MAKKLSYTDIAVLYLHNERRGEWVLMHSLANFHSPYGYIGPSIDRRLRKLGEFQSGPVSHTIKGTTYYIEEKIEGRSPRMVYYRVPFGERMEQKVETVMVDGQPTARITNQPVKV